MASRQQEKEARRRARLEQEEAARRAAAGRKRLQMVLGGVLAVGIVAGVVVAILVGTSSGDSGGPKTAATKGVKLPEQRTTNMQAAAKAAGCTVKTEPDEGRGHAAKTFTAKDYKTNPPTSGTHYPVPAQDGIYDPGNSPALGQSTHSLEHGRIDVQYRPGTSPRLIKQLEAFVGENGGYHMLLFQNTTNMKPQIAATAWDQMLQCPTPGPKMWDALRTFRDRYLDKAPEQVP